MWLILIMLYAGGLALALALFGGASRLNERYDRRNGPVFSRQQLQQSHQQLELIGYPEEGLRSDPDRRSFARSKRSAEPLDIS